VIQRAMKVGFVFDRPLDMAIIELGGNEHVCNTSWIGSHTRDIKPSFLQTKFENYRGK
jgi:hypothetical protein